MWKTYFLILALLSCCNLSFGATIYVDQSANGANNGSSWGDAFTDLQGALTTAVIGDVIWVAEGTYYPTTSTDRNISFQMVQGVDMYGGFNGTESSLADRNWRQHLTVLSGDIGVQNDTIDNTISVVVGPPTSQAIRLDGFVIRDGNGGSSINAGGGFRASNAGSVVVIANCIFLNNLADQGAAMNFVLDDVVLVNCAFYGNRARQYGGVATISDGTLYMMNCIAIGNSAQFGGGLYLSGGVSPVSTHETWLYNSSFYGNYASTAGGDIATVGNGSANIYNSIFWQSSAGITAPNFLEGGMGDTIVPSNCIVENGYPGTSILTLDPLFIDPDGSDNIVGTADDDLRLGVGSPAIDAGNSAWIPNDSGDIDGDGNTSEDLPIDLDEQPRVQNSMPDLGAYEFGTGTQVFPGLAAGLSLEVFPQPSRGTFRVTFELFASQELALKLMSQRGQVVWESHQELNAGEQQIEVNTSLPAGVYLLILSSEGQVGVKKITVQ